MTSSEYGGTPGGELRPDGTRRHVGQIEGSNPSRARDRRQSLMLSGDESGELPVDSAVMEGWDRASNDARIKALPASDIVAVPNPLMDP